MNRLKNKLTNKHGATIIMALVLFLIVTIIGGIVLASATANAGRLTRLREEQQAYLTVSSAVELVRSELEAIDIIRTDVTYQPAGPIIPSTTMSPVENSMSSTVLEWATYNLKLSVTDPSNSASFKITVPGYDDVNAVFYMDEEGTDSNTSLKITVTFSLKDKRYPMTLTMAALLPVIIKTDVEADEQSNNSKTTVTTKYSWDKGIIAKGMK